MVFSAEVLLMASVVCLYLYDSSLLLYCNEGILIPKGRNDWRVSFGSKNLQVMGRELYIPNPFQIHRPLFRLSWKFEGNNEVEPWAPPRRAFSTLAPIVWSMAIALFIFLPLGFFTRLGDLILLPALIILFSSILIALIWIWLNRSNFHLSEKRFAGLAFESLICPPFALNLIRHVAINVSVSEDLVSAARRLQNTIDWTETRVHLLARLDNEIEFEELDSERFKVLQERRRMLAAEIDPCQP